MRLCFLPLLLIGVGYSSAATAAKDTVSVFFRTNESTMTEGMRAQLDQNIMNGEISDRDNLWVIGYADVIGNTKANLGLSRARAKTVKNYLIQTGFRPEQITVVDGKGEEGARPTRGREGYVRDRRVDIVKAAAPPAEPQSDAAFTPPKPQISIPEPAAVHIDLGTVKAGEAIKLENIYFEAGRHYFRKPAYQTLEALYQSMVAYPKVRIKIEGHVCCTPETDVDGEDVDTHKLDLSLNRAKAVRDYLVNKGIAKERMEYEGFGRRRPIVKNELTEEEAMMNRRVEVRVIE